MHKIRKFLKITAATLAILFAVSLTVCTGGRGGALDELSAAEIKALTETATGDYYHDMYVNASTGLEELVSVKSLNLPADLTENTYQPFGLFIYDGSRYVPISEGADLFDEDKKTFFYTHGMGGNGGWAKAKEYTELGYNVCCFFWGAFSREEGLDFTMLCDKVWFYDGDSRYLTESGGDWRDGSAVSCSVVEMYAAYYLDLLLAHPDYDREITVAGHSYGGMLTTGLLSYLTTALRSGVLPAYCLPDRALLCDPYLMPGSADLHIRWLGNLKNGNYGGVNYWAYEALLAARSSGIPVTFFRSSGFIEMPALFGYPDTEEAELVLAKLKGSTLFVNGLVNDLLPLEPAHAFGVVYPSEMTEPVYDALKPEELTFGLCNPAYSDYARVGEVYKIDYNKTPYDFADDAVALEFKGKTKLYGYVFYDANGNGSLDERITKRICGASVTVKNSLGETVYEGKTELNGYFEVRVEPGEYTVSVKMPKGYRSVKSMSINVSEGDYFAEAIFAAVKK